MITGTHFARRCVFSALILALAHALPGSARTLPLIDALATAPAARSAPAAVANIDDATTQTEPRFGVPTFLWGTHGGAALSALQRTPSPKTLHDDEGVARAHLRDVAGPLPHHARPKSMRCRCTTCSASRTAAPSCASATRSTASTSSANRSTCCSTGTADWSPSAASPSVRRRACARARKRIATTAQRRSPRRSPTTDSPPAIAAQPAAAPARTAATRCSRCPKERAAPMAPRWRTPRARSACGSACRRGSCRRTTSKCRCATATSPHDVDYYAYVVSAVDGTLLFRHNQTADAAFTYRVYAEPDGAYLPLPSPGGRNGVSASDGHTRWLPAAVRGAATWSRSTTRRSRKNDPWLPPGADRTIGNNVEAFADLLEPDNFGPPATDECNAALPVDGDLHACTTLGQHVRPHVRLRPGAEREPHAGDGRGDESVLHDQLPARLVLRRRLRRSVGQRADQQLRPRRRRQRQHLSPRRRTSPAPTTPTCPRRRTASGRGCTCSCGRSCDRARQGERAGGDRRRQAIRRRADFGAAVVRPHRRPRARARRGEHRPARRRPTAARRSPTRRRSPARSR